MNSIVKRKIPVLLQEFFNERSAFPLDVFMDKFFDTSFEEFDSFFGKDFFAKSSYPKSDIVEFDDRYEIHCDVPSIKKEDVEITCEDKQDGDLYIFIKGKGREHDSIEKDGGKYLRKEIKYSSFSRSYVFNSENINTEKISSSYENNVLKIIIPFHAIAKNIESKIKKIEIK